jgi:cytochrome b561
MRVAQRASFDLLTISLHWLTAVLIALQAASGLTLEFAASPPLPVLNLHRSLGAIVWCVAIVRIVWRGTYAKFPPFPGWMTGLQKWVATRGEYLIYALLLIQPLTGLATTLMLGKPFALLLWIVPALVPRNLVLWQSMLSVHRIGAYALFGIVGGHAAMALTHHYVFQDDVLERMAPWMNRARRKQSSLGIRNVTQRSN